jgi:hypothetical protein
MGRTHNADRRWAAYHEAGHAVVTIVRAGLVPEIGVNEDGGGYSRPPREHALVRCCIEISLAGLLAEARARKKAEIDVLLDAGQPDFKKAMREASIAAAGEGRNHLSILADAMRIARRVIRDYWPVVARLANAVFEYGDMSREEVAHVAAIHQARAWRYSRSLDDHIRRMRARARVFEAVALGPRFTTPEEYGRGQRGETQQEEEPQHDRISGGVLGTGGRLVGEPTRGEIGRSHAERLNQGDQPERRA